MVRLELKNTDKVIKALEKYGDDAVKEFSNVTKFTAKEIEAEAKRLAPIKDGTLRQNIRAEQQETSLDWKVTSYMPYSAYMEFGTGILVDIKEGWGEMASWFKGKGIKQVNINPRPFMYPAFVKGRSIFMRDIKDAIKALNKKFNG